MADKEKYEKAIRVLQQHKCEEISLYGEEYNLAIKALEEIQQYRSIGTVEECREAVERQRAKKFVKYDNCGNKSVVDRCPNCFEIVNGKYCEYCGQHISREEREGEDD